jgi:hypothetical protein
MADATSAQGHREFRWLIGLIGLLLVLGLAALLLVVLLYRAGPMRRHPLASPTPRATATHALRGRRGASKAIRLSQWMSSLPS